MNDIAFSLKEWSAALQKLSDSLQPKKQYPLEKGIFTAHCTLALRAYEEGRWDEARRFYEAINNLHEPERKKEIQNLAKLLPGLLMDESDAGRETQRVRPNNSKTRSSP